MFNKNKIITLKILSSLIAIFAFAASLTGIICPDIYKNIVLSEKMPFVFGQDLISFIAATILLVIAFFGKKQSIKLDIIRIGITGYLFYAYAPYVMGTIYNYFYFLYLAVFSLSIFYFINAFSCIEYEKLEFTMPKYLRIAITLCCAVIPVFFAPQWIIILLHNILMNLRPTISFAFNYYVYILDLCFILPVCVVSSILIFQKNKFGFLLGGILMIKGFTLMLSVASGFFCHPLFNQNLNIGNVIQFSVLSLIFLVLSIFYLILTKIRMTI